MLNNRDWALIFWLLAFLAFALSQRKVRSGFADVLRSAMKPGIWVPLSCFLAYVGLEVWVGAKVGLWEASLLKDTIVWLAISGLALLFSVTQAAKPGFFRSRLAAAVGISVFLEFFANLYVMSLGAELALQPAVFFLTGFAVVAGRDQRHRYIKRTADGLLALIGFGLLAFVAEQLYVNWESLDRQSEILKFALPLWLTVGLLPFIHFLSLYANYERAFAGIDWAVEGRGPCRAKLALVSKLHFRNRQVQAFNWTWAREAAVAPSFAAARQVVDRFLTSRRKAEQAIIEERQRLRRYAGSDETDAEGRRLDRREFKETVRALRWLATCEMGWYRNEDHGGRYRPELLGLFRDDFVRQGLPSDPGITIEVAENGQAWYAWRRTVTGWCFAIGAAGPPPDQWEYDGPAPPQGFPGEDPRWGAKPLSKEANRNWRS